MVRFRVSGSTRGYYLAELIVQYIVYGSNKYVQMIVDEIADVSESV